MCDKILKYWLIGILLFFPFVKVANDHVGNISPFLTNIISFLDEITIVMFLLIGIGQFLRKREPPPRLFFIILLPIGAFSIFGLTSGMLNGSAFWMALFGTVDYVKYFLVIFVYAFFFSDMEELKKIYRLLLILGLIISAGAIIQEVWALTLRYVLGKDVLDPSIYLFRNPPDSMGQIVPNWRFGLFRASSILDKIDWVGYYTLFVFTIYIFRRGKINYFIFIILLGGILTPVSRSCLVSLVFVLGLWILLRKMHRRKLAAAFAAFMIISSTFLSFAFIDVDELQIQERGQITYREYATLKGMEVWKDHPYIGAGPGMFGGILSIRTMSPLYGDYNFPIRLLEYIGGIDVFWPQIFAETGVIGFTLFLGLLLTLPVTLFVLKKYETNEEVNYLLTGLMAFIFVIYIHTFARGFNITLVVFPYFAFIGMVLSIINSRQQRT